MSLKTHCFSLTGMIQRPGDVTSPLSPVLLPLKPTLPCMSLFSDPLPPLPSPLRSSLPQGYQHNDGGNG